MILLKRIKEKIIQRPNPIWQIMRSARPRQWIKNLALFAPIIFSGQLWERDSFQTALGAFVVFCLASSAAYLFNDLIDLKKDQSHPFKRFRPIASGKLKPELAMAAALLLLATSLTLSYFGFNRFFFMTLALFLSLQFLYSLFFRNVIITDALVVALAFIIRVFAGSFATEASISSWLILATIGVSLLLAFGKRRSERTLLASGNARIQALLHPTRTTLWHYPDVLLDSMISMSASFTIISYSLFSFQISPRFPARVLSNILPPTLSAPKWLMLTIPLVIYGVARYLYVIYEKKEGESPERVILSDLPLLLTMLAWGLSTVAIIYLLGT